MTSQLTDIKPRKLTAIILTFNIIMGLLLFLSSEDILFTLSGNSITSVGLLEVNASNTIGDTITTLNSPFFLFILFIIVNLYFVFKIRKLTTVNTLKN